MDGPAQDFAAQVDARRDDQADVRAPPDCAGHAGSDGAPVGVAAVLPPRDQCLHTHSAPLAFSCSFDIPLVLQLYPLWLCPFKLTAGRGLVHSQTEADQMFVDIGAYGSPTVAQYDARGTTRRLERFVADHQG